MWYVWTGCVVAGIFFVFLWVLAFEEKLHSFSVDDPDDAILFISGTVIFSIIVGAAWILAVSLFVLIGVAWIISNSIKEYAKNRDKEDKTQA